MVLQDDLQVGGDLVNELGSFLLFFYFFAVLPVGEPESLVGLKFSRNFIADILIVVPLLLLGV